MELGYGMPRPLRLGPQVHVSETGVPGLVMGPRTTLGTPGVARGGRRIAAGDCPPPPAGWEWLRDLAVQAGLLKETT